MPLVRHASALIAFSILVAGCATSPVTDNAKQEMRSSVSESLQKFRQSDSSLQAFLDKSYGYAIFPSIGKGGIGIGGANGHGEVYEKGKFIGYTQMSQASIGFQFGGQTFGELLVFQNQAALERFKTGNYELSAQASAVAATAGAAAQSDFRNGIAIFTVTNAGLMYEAAVAGQRFDFEGTSQQGSSQGMAKAE